jgi:hypothetical protein
VGCVFVFVGSGLWVGGWGEGIRMCGDHYRFDFTGEGYTCFFHKKILHTNNIYHYQ